MAVDAATDRYADYYLINCAHPDHFLPNLTDAPWMARLGGVVVNASRCSHEELDNATALDAGNPEELGAALGLVQKLYPPHAHIWRLLWDRYPPYARNRQKHSVVMHRR